MTVGKGGRALNLTAEGVFKTLKTITEGRGRKVGGGRSRRKFSR